MLNLKIIIGSTRPGRAADRVIPWITSASRAHGGFDVDVIDLRDWELPLLVPLRNNVVMPFVALAWWGIALKHARSEGRLPRPIMRAAGALGGAR